MSSLISLSTYLGTRPNTSGRPRRTPLVPQKYRGTFTQALDEKGNVVDIYITDEGKIRTDVEAVQDELEEAGVFRGMQDGWGVDFEELRQAEKAKHVEVDENEEEFEDDSGPDAGQDEEDGDDDYVPDAEEEEDDEDDEMDDLVDDNDEELDGSPVEEEEDEEDNGDEDYQ